MSRFRLPAGLVPHGRSREFTDGDIPDALLNDHSTTEGKWGVLQLAEGSVRFVDMPSGEEVRLTAPDTLLIEPTVPHKLRLDGPLRFHIDFFVSEDDPRAAPGEREARAHELVSESFERCEASGDFAERFYSVFLDASPDVAPHFANTDFTRQRKLLRGTVYIMVTRSVTDPKLRGQLERIGRTHSRTELCIPPHLYEVWLESLLEVVRELDPEWSEELGEAWRLRMRPSIQLIAAAF